MYHQDRREYARPETDESKMDPGVVARVWALRVLFRWLKNGEFPDTNLSRMNIPSEVRGFAMDLVYTTVRWHAYLDAAMKLLVERRPSWDAETAVLLGLCQLLKMEDIPAFAAIHATVEAAKVIGNRRTPVGLINAALRNADRYRRDLDEELKKAPMWVRMSHPEELVKAWTAQWGAAKAAAICAWDNEPADVVVMTLPGGPSVEAIVQTLRLDGVEAEPMAEFPEVAVRLGHGRRVEELPGFLRGDFTVQDPSTLAAVELLEVAPGMRVLDGCASPGGKAARIARLLRGGGKLVALELHEDRIRTLEGTLQRVAPGALGGLVEVRVGDASKVTAEELGGLFDRILLDVPCSNTGVMRRRIDARWNQDPERLMKMRTSQRYILENAPSLLAPGGRIVYSTCSIDEEEGKGQIEAFLARHPEFQCLKMHLNLPGDQGADGAFAAVLERK